MQSFGISNFVILLCSFVWVWRIISKIKNKERLMIADIWRTL